MQCIGINACIVQVLENGGIVQDLLRCEMLAK